MTRATQFSIQSRCVSCFIRRLWAMCDVRRAHHTNVICRTLMRLYCSVLPFRKCFRLNMASYLILWNYSSFGGWFKQKEYWITSDALCLFFGDPWKSLVITKTALFFSLSLSFLQWPFAEPFYSVIVHGIYSINFCAQRLFFLAISFFLLSMPLLKRSETLTWRW